MLALRSTQTHTWSSHKGLHSLLFALYTFFLIYPSNAHVLPYATTPASRKAITVVVVRAPTERSPADLSKEFATTLGVVAAAVIVGTTLICVFAHCWRQILSGKRGGRGVNKKRMRKDEEAWFYRVDPGLPLPQVGSPRLEPKPMSTRVLKKPEAHIKKEPSSRQVACSHDTVVPAGHARTRTKSSLFSSRPKKKTLRKNMASTLPSWHDSDEVGRPQSVAYCMEHPSSFDSNTA
ncbi:hypothetical protein HD806DRAFT_327924 [Xylariaceae sp. AK1471]|nr:hypothetical protein HD806DRAFT_327924 [Xylariaceae sp. AK1471]